MLNPPKIESHFDQKVDVLCFGHFNVIHPGHLRYIQYAAGLGEVLGILVKSDEMLEQESHESSFFSIEDRVRLLESVPIEKKIFSTGNKSLLECVKKIRPSTVVFGRELQKKSDPEISGLVEYCSDNQIKVIFHSGHPFHTERLLHDDFSSQGVANSRSFELACNRRDVSLSALQSVVSQFSSLSGLVIGDTIVDQFAFCEPLGISSEAPVLVVKEQDSSFFVGGGGIVAKHIVSLGAKCKFISVIGNDKHGEFVKDDLSACDVQFHLIEDMLRPTTLKKRYIHGSQKLFRVSSLEEQDVNPDIERQIIDAVEAEIKHIQFIVISDFVYGVITEHILENIVRLAKENEVKIFGDVQSSTQVGNILKLKDLDMIFPTEKEARIALRNKDDSLEYLSREILEISRCSDLVIKLGKDGLIAYMRGESSVIESEHFPALNENAVDVAGAGDSLLASMSLSICAGANVMEASAIGSMVASCAVGRIGNVPVTKKELDELLLRTIRQ